jgi:hypothetical protein
VDDAAVEWSEEGGCGREVDHAGGQVSGDAQVDGDLGKGMCLDVGGASLPGVCHVEKQTVRGLGIQNRIAGRMQVLNIE